MQKQQRQNAICRLSSVRARGAKITGTLVVCAPGRKKTSDLARPSDRCGRAGKTSKLSFKWDALAKNES